MKVKELLNLRINGHSEHIFCQFLGLTSHAKTFLSVCRFRTDLVHLFEWLGVSVIKKLSSVRTAWAIRLRKIVIHSKGLEYPFEKIVIRLNGSGYPFEKEFVNRSSN